MTDTLDVGALASFVDNLLALLFQVYFSDVDTVDQISPNFLFIAEKSILKWLGRGGQFLFKESFLKCNKKIIGNYVKIIGFYFLH